MVPTAKDGISCQCNKNCKHHCYSRKSQNSTLVWGTQQYAVHTIGKEPGRETGNKSLYCSSQQEGISRASSLGCSACRRQHTAHKRLRHGHGGWHADAWHHLAHGSDRGHATHRPHAHSTSRGHRGQGHGFIASLGQAAKSLTHHGAYSHLVESGWLWLVHLERVDLSWRGRGDS